MVILLGKGLSKLSSISGQDFSIEFEQDVFWKPVSFSARYMWKGQTDHAF